MGLIDKINEMNLSDEEKQVLLAEHESDLAPLRESATREAAQNKLSTVEGKVEALRKLGFSEAPAALAFARRVWLSDDEKPAAVLMSDADLGLSGDTATGATGKQEITLSEVLDTFISKIPVTEEGALKITLSEQGIVTEGDDKPETGKDKTAAEQSEEHKQSASGWLGRDIKRTRSRYRRGGIQVGGES